MSDIETSWFEYDTMQERDSTITRAQNRSKNSTMMITTHDIPLRTKRRIYSRTQELKPCGIRDTIRELDTIWGFRGVAK